MIRRELQAAGGSELNIQSQGKGQPIRAFDLGRNERLQNAGLSDRISPPAPVMAGGDRLAVRQRQPFSGSKFTQRPQPNPQASGKRQRERKQNDF